MKTVLTVVGARPQFVKAAPVSRALASAGLREVMVHTGQHFDAAMSEIFFEELDVPRPAHQLMIHSLGHGAMTGRMLEAVEQVMVSEKPDMTLVYGDTNSTLAGALAAAKLNIPVAHVEAGLRSFNRRMPEEINRVMTDHVSALLFCPTATAVENLRVEGVVDDVHAVGDVMYDATIEAVRRAETASTIAARLGLSQGGYSVATVHRAENTDDPARFASVMAWLAKEAKLRQVVFPVHPRTRKLIAAHNVSADGLRLIDPVGYLDMAQLLGGAAAVFTDSGGVQKEAYFHRVPCVTLRDETEWVETIEHGWNRLWTAGGYRPRSDIADYGDGRSAQLIAKIIAKRL
jgi:UDP-GlcNAc3NAcA epimerase